MYVYEKTEPDVWTVGHYDPAGKWVSESDHSTRAEAAQRVCTMNGGGVIFVERPADPKPSTASLVVAELRRLSKATRGQPVSIDVETWMGKAGADEVEVTWKVYVGGSYGRSFHNPSLDGAVLAALAFIDAGNLPDPGARLAPADQLAGDRAAQVAASANAGATAEAAGGLDGYSAEHQTRATDRLMTAADGYPADWPKCHCGRPVLDGHLTCGDARCDEASVRNG